MSEDKKVVKTEKQPLKLEAGEVVRNKEFFSKTVSIKMNRQLLGAVLHKGVAYHYNEIHEVSEELADELFSLTDGNGVYFERL